MLRIRIKEVGAGCVCVTRSQDFFSRKTGGAGVNDIVGRKKGAGGKCKHDQSTVVKRISRLNPSVPP